LRALKLAGKQADPEYHKAYSDLARTFEVIQEFERLKTVQGWSSQPKPSENIDLANPEQKH